jgi:hypothetical protein
MTREPGENTSVPPRLTLDELARLLTAADPAVVLAPPRILRRVIKKDRRLIGFALHPPHRKGYVLDRDALLEYVEPEELGMAPDAGLPEKVVLLVQPSPRRLAAAEPGQLLALYWRLLFHARVHLALEAKLADAEAASRDLAARIDRLGPAVFDEIRAVLDHEELLLPPVDERSVYIEFAAVYLELRRFAPSAVRRYFPGLEDLGAVDELLRTDVDAEELFRATRPAGAALPRDEGELEAWADLPDDDQPLPPTAEPPPDVVSAIKCRVLLERAERPAAAGNFVRAAIVHARAERCAPPELLDRVRSALKNDVRQLVETLRAALEIEPSRPAPWQDTLIALARQTPRGIWTVEARLLYDLQKACLDQQRPIFTVDLVEWALSWGRRPLRRRLPNQRDVLLLKHLRSAAGRIAAARISDGQRRQLARMLREAAARIEARLRRQLRPKIAAALDEVGLKPQNLPERVARKKLIEELLDLIVERGYLAFGDLRDAISRNRLKLPDLDEPMDFIRGDQLLRADRRIALALDGVYRRGEFYLRWMQRLSSLGFGTRIGRFLTRFVVVPFGGAYVALAGVHEIIQLVSGRKTAYEHPSFDAEIEAAAATPAPAGAESAIHLASVEFVFLLGLFLLFLVNSATFRRVVGRACVAAYKTFLAVVVEPIRRALGSPVVQQFLHHRWFIWSLNLLVKPLLATVVIWRLSLPAEAHLSDSLLRGAMLFLPLCILLNSRVGRTSQEVLADWIVQGWHRFGWRPIVGLFWFFVDVFKRFLAGVERMLYSVDEWLRFRGGEGRKSLALKAVLGLLWFCAAYVIRFAVMVLIEPQINPIKHFPVVTVSHKLLVGIVLTMPPGTAKTIAWWVIWGIPGIFGFLVWELKENWRLYAANRRPTLVPVPIGSHGETMGRLLRPGFHSGTLPKCFAKLRRADRRARAGGGWRAVHKSIRALHHLEIALRRWIERQFVEMFVESRAWQATPPSLERIHLATNYARFELRGPGAEQPPLVLTIETRAGWMLADVPQAGWARALDARQRRVLIDALVGLLKTAGIELIRRQLEAEFAPPMPRYAFSRDELIVWPNADNSAEVRYELGESTWLAPRTVRGAARRRLPTIDRQRAVFGDLEVSWVEWVEVWENDAADRGDARNLPPWEFLDAIMFS